MVDAPMDVSLLGFGDGAFEPTLGLYVLSLIHETVADQTLALPDNFVVNPSVHVALLFGRNGALEPASRFVVLSLAREAFANQM